MSYQQQISVSTKGHGDMHDLTEQVVAVVNSSGIQTGTVHVFNVGSTAAVGTIELSPVCSVTCPPFWTRSFRRAATTATNKRGMMATLIRIYRRRWSDLRWSYPSLMASSCSGPGSKFFIWNATCAVGSAPSW